MKPTKQYKGRSHIRMYNCDCMELLDLEREWDLAIVDPPYGIKGGINDNRKTVNPSRSNTMRNFGLQEWDNNTPSKSYFDKLKSKTINQIIWGGNYFPLSEYRCFIVWDKMTFIPTMSRVEMAYTSFDRPAKMVQENSNQRNRIHINQKPVKLYRWLLQNYATEGDAILDTHGGSMSLAIACWEEGFDLDICELDTDYFNDAVARFESHIAQTQLF